MLALDDWTRIHSAAHVSSLASELLPVTPDSTSTKNVEADASLELDGHILNSCAGLNGHNRWFDKAISISVESNSRATVLGEHSPCDALIPSIIADYMLAEGIGKPKGPPKIKSEDGPSATTTKDAGDMGHQQARKLTWVSDQQVVEGIDKAEKTIKDLVDDSEGLVLWYDEYGVEWIKKIGEPIYYALNRTKALIDEKDWQPSSRPMHTYKWPCSLPTRNCMAKERPHTKQPRLASSGEGERIRSERIARTA